MRLTIEQRSSLVTSYQAGTKTAQLSREYGISKVAVCGLLSRRGLLKNQSASQRKYPLQEDGFDTIDDERTAYWLGFLAADGYVRNHALILRLATLDYDHIVKFRDWLQPGKPIQTIHSSDGTAQVGIEIKSKHIVDSLSRHGVATRKTYTFDCRPNMEPHLTKHFYRGYVDGDGSFGYKGSKFWFNLLATEPFLVEFQEWLHNEAGINPTKIGFRRGMWKIDKAGRLVVSSLLDLLYPNATIFLDRKYNAAINILRAGSAQRNQPRLVS